VTERTSEVTSIYNKSMSGFFSGLNLFGSAPKQQTSEEMAKEWKKTLRKEARRVDSDIRKMEFEEKKAMKECKKLSSKGHTEAAKHLVKQVVSTRKAVTRMYSSKAQLNSVVDNLQISMSMMKMQGVLGKSAHVMKEMNNLRNLPEMASTMTEMSREMLKAGLIEEQMEDAMAMMEPDELEDETDAEVNKIMAELTSQTLSGTAALTGKPVVPGAAAQKTAADASAGRAGEEEVEQEPLMDPAELNRIQAKLDTL